MMPDFVEDRALEYTVVLAPRLDCGGVVEFLKQDVMSLDAAIDEPRWFFR